MLGLEELNLNSSSSNNRIMQSISEVEQKENLEQLFKNLILDNSVSHTDTQEGTQSEFDKKFGEQNLTMDIFDKSDTNFNLADFSSLEEQNSGESLQSLTSENMVLLNDILIDKQNTDSEWEAISNDTFLPPNILKQSLGDAALGIGQKKYAYYYY
uniref:Islet cell autoantigen 1 n=1 Tax=Apis cerana TaxID=7461 RepID=V9IF48_APICE